tara:strand:+ start:500 stop:757 length:258 start_codon:yes stop_codon:yes gene_type:complete
MMIRFITEIAVVVIIYLILKKYWNTKVKEYFGNFVIGINIFACFLYFYNIIQQTIPFQLALPKILLHGIVATIIYTLFTIDKKDD